MRSIFSLIILSSLFITSCNIGREKKAERAYNHYCSSCHILPDAKGLPKDIWEKNVLPEMAARYGIKDSLFSPLNGRTYLEQEAIVKSGVFPYRPLISMKDWELVKEHILRVAPDSLANNAVVKTEELTQFNAKPISLSEENGALFTYMEYHKSKEKLMIGDLRGTLSEYDYLLNEFTPLHQFKTPIVAYTDTGEESYITTVGILNPTDLDAGQIHTVANDTVIGKNNHLQRPVFTLVHDFNSDGKNEIVICEHGNLTGKLSLLSEGDDGTYIKKDLLNLPGALRVVYKDMNKDGKDDIVALFGQGQEGIYILYQEENLKFKSEKAIAFSPVYGSSWFELIDYDNDGDYDVVTVNGDNADKSYVHKPYHGMRIHINDGNNKFTETFFYPLNGATRIVARDFDQDGDYDFGLLATFPDYENHPELSFVYLENSDSKSYTFKSFSHKDATLGKWLLMDAADMDQDGDEDIVLSSFTYKFTPAPKEMEQFWNDRNVDLMVFENKLISE